MRVNHDAAARHEPPKLANFAVRGFERTASVVDRLSVSPGFRDGRLPPEGQAPIVLIIGRLVLIHHERLGVLFAHLFWAAVHRGVIFEVVILGDIAQ